jgi:hypothetical protein
VARAIFGIIFKNQGVFLKIWGPLLDFGQVHVVLYKVSEIFPARDLFSNEKFGGPGPRRLDQAVRLGSTVDRGGADKRAQWHLAGVLCAGARAHLCSSAATEEVESDETAL